MDSNNNGGGGSTAIIIILILVVVAGVWYFTKGKNTEAPAPQDNSLDIDLSLGEENGESLPQ